MNWPHKVDLEIVQIPQLLVVQCEYTLRWKMDEAHSIRETRFLLTDDDRSSIQILCRVESLVFCKGIDGYIRLSPRFKVSQALVKKSN